MKRHENKMVERIMVVILTGAVILSYSISPNIILSNLTVNASESKVDAEKEYSETISVDDEREVERTDPVETELNESGENTVISEQVEAEKEETESDAALQSGIYDEEIADEEITNVLSEKESTEELSETITSEDQTLDWNFSVYGTGTRKEADSYKIDSENGSVTIDANSGKIVPDSTDGIAFYYTKIDPRTTNFTFKATAHVNELKYSNGQEGFGIMAADRVGENGNDAPFWNNSYQAVISKITYKWNGIEEVTDGSGERIQMHLGVGATEKKGVTPDDLSKISEGMAVKPEKYCAAQSTIDTTYAKYGEGTYNIVGNCTNSWVVDQHEQYVNFELQLQKNNTGYFVSYTKVDDDGNYILDESGKTITTTKKYYDTDALNVLEEDSVYIGVFAARNANVTFTDMNLTTISPEEDASVEKRPTKYLNLSNKILSGTVTNTSDYEFIFQSNWNGRLVLKDDDGNILTKHTQKDDNGNETEIDYYHVMGSVDPERAGLWDGDESKNTKVYIDIDHLSVGKNVFTVEFTPDRDWVPETNESFLALKSYEKITLTHVIEYRKYGEQGQTIYVSPDGTSANTGTKDNPLDIYTAVKYAQPGQTILLAGGHYSLMKTLMIPKGVDGAPDITGGKETYLKYIRMMASDPENRPVLDFNGQPAFMVTCGDYWYFKNFDVTRCETDDKSIQISGSHCVFDRVDAYKNRGTGFQICRESLEDTYKDWPSDNLILNCNAYLNADPGYEDADGFAAKPACGSNNVFDGCISAFNADDGWDLFMSVNTGNIGAVTIKNCVAYRNGYILLADTNDKESFDEFGTLVKCYTGSGFKMGGSSLAGGSRYDADYDPSGVIPYSGHKLINSLAFYNGWNGVNANSSPNVKVYNTVLFNNGTSSAKGKNIYFDTTSSNRNTDYELKNVISIRNDGMSFSDTVSTKGKQDLDKVTNDTVYYWNTDENAAVNANDIKITADDFISLDYSGLNKIDKTYWRNEDGTINMHGFLQLKDGVLTDTVNGDKPTVGGAASNQLVVGEDTDGKITGVVETESTPESSGANETESIPESSVANETESIPESSVANETESIPESSMANETEHIPESSVEIETESIPESSVVNETESIPESSEVDETESIPESSEADETESIPESSVANETESIPESVETDETESTPESSETGNESENVVRIAGLEEYYDYTGAKIIPDIKVLDYGRDGGTVLTEGVDYTITVRNNTKVTDTKPAEITVVGKGNYTGKNITAQFHIKEVDNHIEAPVNVNGAKIEIAANAGDMVYTGDAKYPDFTLTLKGKTPVRYTRNTDTKDNKSLYRRADGELMDINVAVSGNVNKGTATILVTGAKDSKGKSTSAKKTFKITPVDLSKATTDEIQIEVSDAEYAVKGAIPETLTVTYKGKTLKNGKDYTVKYANNKKAGGQGTVTITGKGNYAKKCSSVPYSIKRLDLSRSHVKAITAYKGVKAGKVKATVVDGNGTALKASQYKLIIYKVSETEAVGDAYAETELLDKGRVYVQVEARDTDNLTGKTDLGNGKKEAEFWVGTDIARAKCSLQKGVLKEYTGKGIELNDSDLVITAKGVTDPLRMGVDYEIVSYENNTNKGTATAVIKGINDYSGTKKVKFKIVQRTMR